jgi:hypothetical protein
MTAGIPMRKIGTEMGGIEVTDRMLGHYRSGTEPLHWRGDLLIAFWCRTLDRNREDRPMREVTRGRYRASTIMRPSHVVMQPGYDGPLKAKVEGLDDPEVEPDVEPVSQAEPPARRKPGPKPGSKRVKVEEVV